MTQRFQSKYDGPKKKTAAGRRLGAVPDKCSVNITKLLLKYMERPSMKAQCKTWAKLRTTFEAEVDQRLPEVRKEKGNPRYARIGLWNTMASEGYAAASDEEKEETVKKAYQTLAEETKEWKDRLSEPKSVEEAIRYVQRVFDKIETMKPSEKVHEDGSSVPRGPDAILC